jgi:hypothetical protein
MAGLGLLTLLGAWFLSSTGKDESALAGPVPAATAPRTKKEALQPTEQAERIARVAPPPGPVEIDDDTAPIGGATEEARKAARDDTPSSQPVHAASPQQQNALVADFKDGLTGPARQPVALKPVTKPNPPAPAKPKPKAAPKKPDPDDYDFGI